jgi:hypothetical protein
MSDEELAQGLHKKYYSDMPFDEFSNKIGYKAKPKEEESKIETFRKAVDPTSVVRGLTMGTLGFPGALEELGAYTIPRALGFKVEDQPSPTGGKTLFPTPEEVGKWKMLQYEGGKPSKTEEKIEKVSEFVPAAIGGVGLIKSGIKALTGRGGKELADALKVAKDRGDKLIAQATTEAEKTAARAEKERLISETLISRQQAKAQKTVSEGEKVQDLARQETNLPAPHTSVDIAKKNDVGSKLRELGAQKFAAAEKQQQTIGGKAFEEYKNVAAQKQAVEPFSVSKPGLALKAELEGIIEGGAGPLRTYGESSINLAKKIKNELFGIGEEAKPVDFKLVDDMLRELRQTEASKAPEAATKIARERYKSAADSIEEALKKWVGEENYPREAYAKASEAFNKFRTDLGEALSAREEIPYAKEPGAYKVPEGKLPKLVFGSRENVKYAKDILGETEVSALAEQHAVNQLAGKDAKAVNDWLNKAENAFIFEVPGLPEKLAKYGLSLARREGDIAVAERLVKQYGKDIETAGKTAEKTKANVSKVKDTLDDLRIKMTDSSPAKLQDEWTKAGGLRKKLEDTGMFQPAQLDELGQDIAKVGAAASKVERAKLANDVGIKILKYAGVPSGVVAAGSYLMKD